MKSINYLIRTKFLFGRAEGFFSSSNYTKAPKLLSAFALIALFFLPIILKAQTNPAPHDLSASNFSFTGFASNATIVYPTSMQGWNVSGNNITTAQVNAPTGDRALSANVALTFFGISNRRDSGFSILNGTNPVRNVGSICLSLNTTNRQNIIVNWTAEDLSALNTNFQTGLSLQYRVGTSGDFTDYGASGLYTTTVAGKKAAQAFSNIALPAACNNQPVVQLRWIYYQISATGTARDPIRLDEITVSSSSNLCTGTPSPGNTLATLTTVTNGNTTTLSLQNTTAGSNITYQWQSSTDNVTWTNVTGATNATYTPTITSRIYFRCVVTCSGNSGTSTSILINVDYCASTASQTLFHITSFTTTGGTANISNITNAASTNGYGNFTAQAVSTNPNATINFSVGLSGVNETYGLAIFVDWNNNAVFDVAEKMFTTNSYLPSPIVGSFTIPSTATAGSYRMRVVANYNSTMPAACNAMVYGETEDYTVTILPATPCSGTPVGGTATVTPNSGDAGAAITLNATGVSYNSGLTYQWQSSTDGGTTWTNIAGATTLTFATTISATAVSNTNIFYRVIVTCTSNGQSSNSLPASFSVGSYCIPTVTNASSHYIQKIAFQGTLQDVVNTSTFSTSPIGYQNFTGLALKCIQAQGGGINLNVENNGIRALIKAWVDWNANGTFEAAELVYTSDGTLTTTAVFGFVVPTTVAPGNYRIRIRTTNLGATTYSTCENLSDGEAEDYLITVIASCPTFITGVNGALICGSGNANLSVTGSAGTTQYNWYAAPNAIIPVATTSSPSWTTPGVVRTETYYVTASNGTCESVEKTPIKVVYSTLPVISFNPDNPVVCGGTVATSLLLSATGDNEEAFLINENFEAGLGSFTVGNLINNQNAVRDSTQWRQKTSVYVSNYTTTWRPAISSGFGPNKFAFATSDVANASVNTTLTSASFNTTNFTSLSLDCSVYYSHYLADGITSIPDSLVIEVSTNNGTTWTREQTFIEDQGIGTRFLDISLNLSAYINVNQFRIRFRYRGEWCDGVAIDDVKLYGNRPLSTTYSWSPITGNNLFLNAAGTTPYTGGSVANIYYKPTQAQIDTGGVFPFTATALLSNGCSASRTINITLTANQWTGASSSNWNDLGNWCGGILPTPASRVVIPANAVRFPILSNNGDAKTIRIDAGATMTIANTGTLSLGENLANAGTFANNGILNLNGNAAQVIPGPGVISSMNILRIANRGSGVSLNNSMFIDNEIRPDSGKLNLGNFDITLKSNATRTASVQKIGNTSGFLYGSGRFVVERYIPTGTGAGQHAKSWQHMAVPTNGGQTIKQAWQEGAFAANANANPGFGTMITGAVLNATNSAIGFDAYTPNGGASIKTYNGSLNKWDFVTNTTNTPVYNPKGYLLFVRGDRSVINFSGANSQPIPTTLRTRGRLFEPVTNEPQVVNLAPNVLESIGNPYASAIDFSQIEFSNGIPELITNKFWIFDPTLNTANNFGGWQLLTQTVSGDFTPIPGGTVNYPAGVVNSKIQSGQAFIMQAGSAGGSVTFTEDAKLSGSLNTFRSPRQVLNRMSMGINLHASHNGTLVDGAMVVWDRSFASTIDQNDANKLMNAAENFGIISNAKILTLESRNISALTDTVKLYIKNLRRQTYQMKFNPKFFEPEVNSITLIDKFTNQSTTIPKNDTSTYVFTVGTQAASFDSSRFTIILNIKKRIQAITLAQTEQDQNEIVKNRIQTKIIAQSINVYPNPVSGNKLTLSVQNFEAGEYYLEIKNILGVVVKKMNLNVLNDSENFNIDLPKHISKGVYYLQFTNGLVEERMQMVVN